MIPFFIDEISFRSFYVESIEHSLSESCQEVRIFCKHGNLNTYWKWRKDKALIEREISIHDYFDETDYILQDRLIRNRY